jgi:hypothetical protein
MHTMTKSKLTLLSISFAIALAVCGYAMSVQYASAQNCTTTCQTIGDFQYCNTTCY